MAVSNKSYTNVRYSDGTETYFSRVRNSSGNDGRTEVNTSGKIVPKWNAYSLSYSETWAVRPYGTKCHHLALPPYAPNTTCANLATPSCTAPAWDSNLENQLLNKLASDIRRHQFNAGVFLGEGRQATQMVIGTITGIKRGFIRALDSALNRKPRLGRRRRLTDRDISNAYLQTVFGWLPLIQDTYEAMKAFEALTSVRSSRYHAKATIGVSCSSSADPNSYSGTAVRRRKILYEMWEDISAARSLGLDNPASVLWELTPWSFLFDYFLPFGTYLDNLAIIPKLKGRFLLTEKVQVDAVARRPLPTKNAGGALTDLYGAPNEKAYHTYTFTRTPTDYAPSVPLPSFRKLPEALQGRRIYNVVALSHQQVRRFLERYS